VKHEAIVASFGSVQVVVGELWDCQHVIEGRTVDGEECDGLVRCEGAKRLCAEKSLPLLGGGVPLRDRGNAWEEDRGLVRAAGVVALFPDVDVAEFPGDVLHGAFGRTECDDVGEVPEERGGRVFITDRRDVRVDRLRRDDADDAECARGVEELRVARATDLLVLIAQEEDWPALTRSRRQLGARVDGFE